MVGGCVARQRKRNRAGKKHKHKPPHQQTKATTRSTSRSVPFFFCLLRIAFYHPYLFPLLPPSFPPLPTGISILFYIILFAFYIPPTTFQNYIPAPSTFPPSFLKRHRPSFLHRQPTRLRHSCAIQTVPFRHHRLCSSFYDINKFLHFHHIRPCKALRKRVDRNRRAPPSSHRAAHGVCGQLILYFQHPLRPTHFDPLVVPPYGGGAT